MTRYSRRGFLAASAAMSAGLATGSGASLLLPTRARAAASAPAHTLAVSTRVIEVQGRAATIFGLANETGQQGLTLDPGERFRVDLTNTLDQQTLIHWHGQIPPNDQDGAPNTNPMLAAGETRAYDFAPRPGTFWMHSHVVAQEVGQMAAPLIVRRPEDLTADRQEVVMFLHDFSFRSPEEVLAQAMSGDDDDAQGMGGAGMTGQMAGAMGNGGMMQGGMSGSMSGSMSGAGAGHMGGQMSGQMTGRMSGQMTGQMAGTAMGMDLNDFDFDAYLANDRTLEDPDVVRVDRGGRVLLRIINAASMTSFWIDTGALPGRLIAVDGEPVQPMQGQRFPIAPAQRLEITLDLPADATAHPILALREGGRERTGMILAPKGSAVPRLSSLSDDVTPPAAGDMRLEQSLRAVSPLTDRAPDLQTEVTLGGQMDPYVWTINGDVWDHHVPITVPHGARMEMTYVNGSMMAHPMHLHGHVFQVVGIGDQRFRGALRDTVTVPAMGTVTIAFDAGEAAPWLLHCHHMAHLVAGMMTELQVTSPRSGA